MKEKKDDEKVMYLPLGMSIGLSIGVAIGAALNNIPLYMCIGLSIGVGLGAVLDAKNHQKKRPEEQDENKDAT